MRKNLDFLFFVSIHFKGISFIKMKWIIFFYVDHFLKDFHHKIDRLLEFFAEVFTKPVQTPLAAQFTPPGASAPSFVFLGR